MSARPYGPAYSALLGLSAFFALGAILTLIPNPAASWPNILGYKSICTFAPGATFACALLAAITCALRARFVKRSSLPLFVSTTVIVLLAAGLAWSTAVWAGVKAQYVDARSSATTAK